VALPNAAPASPPTPLLLAHAAVSTSGDASQWLEVDGVRYSHVFDPRTGQALRGHRSVTVVAPSGLMADALATATSVLGPWAGRELVEAEPGAALRFVEEDHCGPIVTESGGFASLPRAASTPLLAAQAAAPTDH
jgi:thiamine biosynthesis lipoprotein